jgi:hypothetical protein
LTECAQLNAVIGADKYLNWYLWDARDNQCDGDRAQAAPAPPVLRGGDSPTIPTWKLEEMGTR